MIPKFYLNTVCIISILLVALLSCRASDTAKITIESQSIESIHVIDGDTFHTPDRKIRLWGIDAPEKNQQNGYSATLLLTQILKEGNIECKFIQKDKYQRDVMKCAVNGSDVGSMMVQMGQAKDYKYFSDGYYDFEESIAKSKKIGIWKNSMNDEI